VAWAVPADEPPETVPPLSERCDEPEPLLPEPLLPEPLLPEPLLLEPDDVEPCVPAECAADEAPLPELACAAPGRTATRPADATVLATATPVVIADSRRRPRRRSAAGDAGRPVWE
jgi:hypothetical protein